MRGATSWKDQRSRTLYVLLGGVSGREFLEAAAVFLA